MPHRPASEALSRFTVLDLTRVRSGPTCVRQLGDWGADVIKIEMPASVEGDGGMGGPRHGPDFQNLHRNKRSITLNLKEPEGVEIFLRLAANADVVVENYRPDVKRRLGIDYESLRRINPRLVYASISGFGQDGPYKDRPGFDQIAQGMGGIMSITGLPGQGPVRTGIPIADLCAGLLCAHGIMVALLDREVTGEGQWVQSSLLAAQIFMLDFQAARWLVDQEVAPQAGNNHPTSIPTGVFETSDGYINIAVGGQPMWRLFCETLGKPELVEQPDFATGALRSKNRDAVNAAINEVTRNDTSAGWIDRLNQAGVPCGPIYSIDQVFDDPQVKHIGMAEKIESPEIGETELVAQAIKLSRTPSRLAVAPPERGQHTDDVLGELGYSTTQLTDLRDRQVI